ncbi:hypothetical protein AK812_SmicGene8259 [Symbiodinium microadriaticum]|uniref:Uncharacterized protein n=1 Tax=Symbiodinium microadriaticum TaxID=2951 RepID=A0A1Q9ELD7_SYMMI|nr:hypothetical protein AK812_SmicGene8259 [Symbiodinium microadriaticum]
MLQGKERFCLGLRVPNAAPSARHFTPQRQFAQQLVLDFAVGVSLSIATDRVWGLGGTVAPAPGFRYPVTLPTGYVLCVNSMGEHEDDGQGKERFCQGLRVPNAAPSTRTRCAMRHFTPQRQFAQQLVPDFAVGVSLSIATDRVWGLGGYVLRVSSMGEHEDDGQGKARMARIISISCLSKARMARIMSISCLSKARMARIMSISCLRASAARVLTLRKAMTMVMGCAEDSPRTRQIDARFLDAVLDFGFALRYDCTIMVTVYKVFLQGLIKLLFRMG